jgi:hypothetical protein
MNGLIFMSRLGTERRIQQVSKNDACRFRFITSKQICSLVQEGFGERRISLDASYDGFLEIASEHQVNYLLRFPEAAERLVLGLAGRKDIASGVLIGA